MPRLTSAARRRSHVLLWMLMAAAIGGSISACGAGRLPAASSPAGPTEMPGIATPGIATPMPATSAPAGTPAEVAPSRDASPAPTDVPGPPVAAITGLAGADGPLPGAVGTFTWDGLTSDAPWVVPSAGGTAAARAPLEVSFVPPLAPSSWVARWAPLMGSAAGDPVPAGEGGPGRVRLPAPARSGVWGLQVEARFGDGRNAAWYWRVEVMP